MLQNAVSDLRPPLTVPNSLDQDVPDIDYINEYLAENEHKELLKFLTCGSVDDGKSTLIGRLLYDTNKVYEDHLSALLRDSSRLGRTDSEPDFALLADGLKAEQEQGITIDVAYRYFTTRARKYIIADCPGHSQYTKNMATGASNCELAVILIDAQNGVLDQTRRHSLIVSLLGIRQLIVAVNKMDLVHYDAAIYERIQAEYLAFAKGLNFTSVSFVPVAAKFGENIVEPSVNMPWYEGATIVDLLEAAPVAVARDLGHFCMTVQRVHRPGTDFRGYSGTVTKGLIHPGDPIVVLPAGIETHVERIVTMDGDLDVAHAPQSVTLTISDQLGVNRGDTFVSPQYKPQIGNELFTNIVWMNNKPLVPNKSYLFKLGAKQLSGKVSTIVHRLNVNTQVLEPCDELAVNEIGLVHIDLQQPVVYEDYETDKTMGSLIVIDRITNETVGAGMINHNLSSGASNR
ncbi:MAG: sulfate adenylyltransferase subunit CysN [Gammaproteobacteria bacterium]|nr:sulfate adenylyltransferase subunit CysN [Gammaproteobacteria bacterium]